MGGTSEEAWADYAHEMGLRLQRARQTTGLSQERVAAAAGISAFTYRKLVEHGQSNPGSPGTLRLRTLVALAETLGVTVNDLLPDPPAGVAEGQVMLKGRD